MNAFYIRETVVSVLALVAIAAVVVVTVRSCL